MTDAAPEVFISYCHVPSEAKEWAARLAARLIEDGFPTLIDVYELVPGDNLVHFMEKLPKCDFVLFICNPESCKRYNSSRGGAGFEKTLAATPLLADSTSGRCIPIIQAHEGNSTAVVPTFLSGRLYINMSEKFEERYLELKSTLRGKKLKTKPKLGDYVVHDHVSALSPPSATSDDPVSVYDSAFGIATKGDLNAWNKMSRQVRDRAQNSLSALSAKITAKLGPGRSPNTRDTINALDEGLTAVSPMIALALAGVMSRAPRFDDQHELISDIIEIDGWPRSQGRLQFFPMDLACLAHFLIGSATMLTSRLDLAMACCHSMFMDPSYRQMTTVGESNILTGWLRIFPGQPADLGWQAITTIMRSATWIDHCLGGRERAMQGLWAFCHYLTLEEGARRSAQIMTNDPEATPTSTVHGSIYPDLPFYFLLENDPASLRGYTLFLRNRLNIPEVWRHYDIPDKVMPLWWEAWTTASKSWLVSVGYIQMRFTGAEVPNESLMVDLGLLQRRPELES